MSEHPVGRSPIEMFTSGRFRLRGGKIGTYADACQECIAYWTIKLEEARERLAYYEEELRKEPK